MLKIKKLLLQTGKKLRAGVIFIWSRPIFVSVILLIAGYFLFNMIFKEAFKEYANCYYIVDHLPLKPRVICDGVDLLLFKLDGLNPVLNPLLEKARITALWGIFAVFAMISMLLTVLVNNMKTLIKIFTFDKEAWMKLLASARTWLIFMIIFGAFFYYMTIK